MKSHKDLLEVNQSFYDAFESLDVESMGEVWAQSGDDVCIHPGWEILTGWKDVRASWQTIFANTAFMRVDVTDVAVTQWEKTARITCVENLFTVIDGQTIHSRVACTNLFIYTDNGWRLSSHHGSAMASQPIDIPQTDIN